MILLVSSSQLGFFFRGSACLLHFLPTPLVKGTKDFCLSLDRRAYIDVLMRFVQSIFELKLCMYVKLDL